MEIFLCGAYLPKYIHACDIVSLLLDCDPCRGRKLSACSGRQHCTVQWACTGGSTAQGGTAKTQRVMKWLS